jgi:hypothetical protein
MKILKNLTEKVKRASINAQNNPYFPLYFVGKASIFIVLIYLVLSVQIDENLFLLITVSFSSGLLSYYLSDWIKFSVNKYMSFLQKLILNVFIIFIITVLYVVLISIDLSNLFEIIHLDDIKPEELSKEISQNIQTKKISVELQKTPENVEVYNITVEKGILDKLSKMGEDILSTMMSGIISQIGPAAAGGTIGAQALKITSAANLP